MKPRAFAGADASHAWHVIASATAVCVAFLVAPSAARADGRRLHFDLETTTELPVSAGYAFGLELPRRIQLRTSMGYMPADYVRLINRMAVNNGWYDEGIASLLAEATRTSTVFRTSAGWRPFASQGLYVNAGYQVITFSGLFATEGYLAAQGVSLADDIRHLLPVYWIRSTLHFATIEVGWSVLVAARIVIRAGVDAAFLLGSSTALTPRTPEEELPEYRRRADSIESGVNDVVARHPVIPTFLLSVGYRVY